MEVERRNAALCAAGVDHLRRLVRENQIVCQSSDWGRLYVTVDGAGGTHLSEPARNYRRLDRPCSWVEREQLHDMLGTAFYTRAIHAADSALVQPAALMLGLGRTLPANVRVYEVKSRPRDLFGDAPAPDLPPGGGSRAQPDPGQQRVRRGDGSCPLAYRTDCDLRQPDPATPAGRTLPSRHRARVRAAACRPRRQHCSPDPGSPVAPAQLLQRRAHQADRARRTGPCGTTARCSDGWPTGSTPSSPRMRARSPVAPRPACFLPNRFAECAARCRTSWSRCRQRDFCLPIPFFEWSSTVACAPSRANAPNSRGRLSAADGGSGTGNRGQGHVVGMVHPASGGGVRMRTARRRPRCGAATGGPDDTVTASL